MCSLFCKCNECAAALCAGTGSTGDAPRIGRGTSQSQTIQRGRQQTPLRVVALAPRVPIPRHHHVRATAVRLAIAKPMNAASGAMTDSHDRGRAHGRRLTGHGLHHTAARHHPTATIGPHRCARSGQSTYCFRHPPLFTHFFTLFARRRGDRADRRCDDRRYDDRRRSPPGYRRSPPPYRRSPPRHYNDRRYEDRRRYDDWRRYDDRRRSPPPYRRRSPSLSRSPPRRKSAPAAPVNDGKPKRFWDGFQWVDADQTTVTAQVGPLGQATRKDRRLYVGNLPVGSGLQEKQLSEFISR